MFSNTLRLCSFKILLALPLSFINLNKSNISLLKPSDLWKSSKPRIRLIKALVLKDS